MNIWKKWIKDLERQYREGPLKKDEVMEILVACLKYQTGDPKNDEKVEAAYKKWLEQEGWVRS